MFSGEGILGAVVRCFLPGFTSAELGLVVLILERAISRYTAYKINVRAARIMAARRIDQIQDHIHHPIQLPHRATATKMASPTQQLDTPLGIARKIRIITIGAGASGLNLVRALRLHLEPGSYTHQVYEKNPCVGGTWYENRYPGCRCDIPSHNYQFSWKPNPEWTSFFSPAEEIGAYLCKICEEEDMAREIRLSCIVVGAEWVKDEAVWKVKLRDVKTGKEFEDRGEVLINAAGILK